MSSAFGSLSLPCCVVDTYESACTYKCNLSTIAAVGCSISLLRCKYVLVSLVNFFTIKGFTILNHIFCYIIRSLHKKKLLLGCRIPKITIFMYFPPQKRKNSSTTLFCQNYLFNVSKTKSLVSIIVSKFEVNIFLNEKNCENGSNSQQHFQNNLKIIGLPGLAVYRKLSMIFANLFLK